MKKQKLALEALAKLYPEAKPELDFRTNFELLVAVILSAQCTDKRVNIVTNELFKNYDTPEKMLVLSQSELENKIRTCGLAPSKSKNILKTCQMLVDDFGCQIPKDIITLQKLPGVGRKTANVVVSVAFGTPAIAVDTHVFRVSNRIGLAHAKDVLTTEKQLMEIIPKRDWSQAHHWLILHGRRVCIARSPKCDKCRVTEFCEYYENNNILNA